MLDGSRHGLQQLVRALDPAALVINDLGSSSCCGKHFNAADKAAEASARLGHWANDRSEPRTVVLGAEGFQGWSYWKPPVPGQGNGSSTDGGAGAGAGCSGGRAAQK